MSENYLKAEPLTIPPTRVRWSNIGGNVYEGEVTDVDSNVLVVKCDDGVTRYVEDYENYVVDISNKRAPVRCEEIKNILEDLQNPGLPRDIDRACKFVEELPPLLPGIRLEWYYQEDLDYIEESYEDEEVNEDNFELYEHSGFLVPCDDMDAGRADARDGDFERWILVVDRYPTEKESVLITWVAFNRFLDADNLVKVRVRPE